MQIMGTDEYPHHTRLGAGDNLSMSTANLRDWRSVQTGLFWLIPVSVVIAMTLLVRQFLNISVWVPWLIIAPLHQQFITACNLRHFKDLLMHTEPSETTNYIYNGEFF